VRTPADGDGRIGATFGTEGRGFESLRAYHPTGSKLGRLRAGSPASAADDSNGDSNPGGRAAALRAKAAGESPGNRRAASLRRPRGWPRF
jgi:hypothetical protein